MVTDRNGLHGIVCDRCKAELESKPEAPWSDRSRVMFELLLSQCDLNHERIWVLFFQGYKRLAEPEVFAIGTYNKAIYDLRRVFSRGIELQADGLVIAHNHPGYYGDVTPSKTDIRMTRDLIISCRSMRISLIDHIIVARDQQGNAKMFSFTASGIFAGGRMRRRHRNAAQE